MGNEGYNRVIYACDVGSVRGGTFAWARVTPGGMPCASTDIDDLVMRLCVDAEAGMSVSLGFESPLFLPIPRDSGQLSRGRQGDGCRSTFAPAGAAVTTLGIHEAAWILRAVRDRCANRMAYTLDWQQWPPQAKTGQILLAWEAFVSGNAHGSSHEQDAVTAAMFFLDNENDLNAVNAVTAAEPMCLFHAAALWSGWADDLERLHQGCLVLKPKQRYPELPSNCP